MRLHRRLAPASLLLSLLLASAPTAHAGSLFARAPLNPGRARALAAAPAATILTVDPVEVARFRRVNGGTVSVPFGESGSLELALEPLDMLAPGASVTSTDDQGPHPIAVDLSLYKGKVAGDPDSWALISLSPNGAMGTIVTHGERYQLMPTAPPAAGVTPLHALAAEGALHSEGSAFHCGIDETNEAAYTVPVPAAGTRPRGSATPDGAQLNGQRLVFDAAIDCDYEIYANKFGGNLTNATNYMLTVLATVSLIYERDLESTLRISYLNLWTTAADPYTQGTTSGELPEFASYWQANRSGVSRSLAHLVSGRALGGGIAYINGICSNSSGYAVSAIDAAYSYPTNTTTWDVEVIAHEMGHNFGSYHTHSCFWQANGYIPAGATLDSCQAREGTCGGGYPNHVPPDKGTIMSYCHLLTGVANGIRLDFHPVCITVMRAVSSSAGCNSLPAIAPPRPLTVTNSGTGAHLAWSAGGAPGVLGYTVAASRTQLDLAPATIGTTAGLSFDVPGLGTYYYRVKADRAADSSGWSAEAKAAVCPFTTGPRLTVGSQPVAVVTGDWNGDGIADLAVLNASAASVSILLGNGSGGVGTGTFAPATSVPTGTAPSCMVVRDLNGDGVPDLLVGATADTALYLHLGNGANGVGNGTFAAGIRIPCGDVPAAIALGDFDEDGITDIALAGGISTVATLRGLGTAGIASGQFASPVEIPVLGRSRNVLVADWNHDGIWDLGVTGTTLEILLGNGTGGKGDGTFAAAVSYPVGGTPSDMAAADWNADGALDIVVCNTGASVLSVLLGDGSGAFGSTISVPCGVGPNRVAVADWNQDGIPDVAIANNNGSNIASVLLGRGDGTFDVPQTYPVNSSSTALALGDWNGDGGVDLAVANKGDLSVSPLLWSCHPAISTSLALSAPAGGESWVEDDERTLTWSKGAGVTLVDVQLSLDGGQTWRVLADHVSGTSFAWTVNGPGSTHARIRVLDSVRPQIVAATPADFTIIPKSALAVDGGALQRFGLVEAWPNPASGELHVALTLPEGGDGASLELLDLAGRRVASRDLGGYGSGLQQVTLLHGSALRPGMYLVRLSRAGEVQSRKVAILH